MEEFDVVIIGTGPAGLGAAFELLEHFPGDRYSRSNANNTNYDCTEEGRSEAETSHNGKRGTGNKGITLLLLDRQNYCSGGLRNDCKMNFTYPIGFPVDNWDQPAAERCLKKVKKILKPDIMRKENLSTYTKRAERLGVRLVEVEQTHLGTDGGLELIKKLYARLEEMGARFGLNETVEKIDNHRKVIITDKREISYKTLLAAPGRQGFRFIQQLMDDLNVAYMDHIVDIGLRIETRIEHYPIVDDYYDPKFIFPEKVRTFCTNSGNAHVVKESYTAPDGSAYFSVNGHAFSTANKKSNGLVNFAMLNTVRFTEPLASGQQFAENLGRQAMLMGGGQPIMQRIGDFRLGKRSKAHLFTGDLYDFKPTLGSCCPGDISLAAPAKILRNIWKALKMLDTIVPGVLHPSTIMYYPEIKLYANKPTFMDGSFQVAPGVFIAGDGAGTSRGITAAWASGVRAAEGMALQL